MGFLTPKVPANPPPPPNPPSISATLMNRPRNAFGVGRGSLGGTFITGPSGNPLGNLPGSTGQSGMKTLLGS